MGALLDIQGVQNPVFGERGIARYLRELASALERDHPDAVSRYLLNPDLPAPAAVDSIPSWRIGLNDRVDLADASVYHVGSPFEGAPIDRIWPAAASQAGLRLAVTLYDLIPEHFADAYLANPVARVRYRTRLATLRRADRFLAISEATAKDATELLDIPAERIRVVGAAPPGHFVRPPSREAAFATLAEQQPWLRPGYILCTGGVDYRKNVDRLLEAYAALPPGLRARHQLAIVCRVQPAEREALERRFDELGIAADARLAGYVPDDVLVLFYQAAGLVVYPSLYEGYGLPVAEALSCGAPVLTSRSSSLVELVEDDAALFDPTDPRSIREALERALTDDDVLARLSSLTLGKRHTWPEVARRTAATYEELEREGRRPTRRRRRIGHVSRGAGTGRPGYCKLCELEDFADPELRELIREAYANDADELGPEFPAGFEHRKNWEIAMSLRAFRDFGVLGPTSDVLGVGAGAEATIFWLTNHCRRVFATDLYVGNDEWGSQAPDTMLTDPGAVATCAWDPQRLVAQHMDALDLRYDDGSFDGVFSSGSIEHFGTPDDVRRALTEMHRVLRPGGIAALSTEFRLGGRAMSLPGTLLFDEDGLYALLDPDLWELVEPLDLSMSESTTSVVVDIDEAVARYQEGRRDRSLFPHLVLQHRAGVLWTSVHVVLRAR